MRVLLQVIGWEHLLVKHAHNEYSIGFREIERRMPADFKSAQALLD
jgi:hypothetical protein